MSIDLGVVIRRLRIDKRRTPPAPRSLEALISVEDVADRATGGIVLDTNVYIHDAGGRLPPAVAALKDRSLNYHCSVCLAELSTGVANADPAHPGWPKLRDLYVDLFDALPLGRILTPDDDIWIEAGMIAGLLARTRRMQPHQRKECLNDALIFLTAAKAGLPVLTANRTDFDLIQQIAGRGHFVWF